MMPVRVRATALPCGGVKFQWHNPTTHSYGKRTFHSSAPASFVNRQLTADVGAPWIWMVPELPEVEIEFIVEAVPA